MTNEQALNLRHGQPVTMYPAHEEAPAWSSVVLAVREDGSQVAVRVDSRPDDTPLWWVNSRNVHTGAASSPAGQPAPRVAVDTSTPARVLA